MPERIQIVDEQDQPTGFATREEAWRDGLYHRFIRIILQDENGRVLSQRRSPTKKLHPNCWTDAVSGHVDFGESYEQAAAHELLEELGLKVKLEQIGTFLFQNVTGEKKINQFTAVFKGIIPSITQLKLEPGEVSEARWFDPGDLKQQMASNPGDFTPGMVEVTKRYGGLVVDKAQ